MGLELAPLALEEGVGEDQKELPALVDALNNVLNQGDTNLGNKTVTSKGFADINYTLTAY